MLSQHGVLAPVIIHQRIDFAASMIDGRTVMELPGKSRSTEEVEKLWSYVNDRLMGRVARRVLPVSRQRAGDNRALAMAGVGRPDPT